MANPPDIRIQIAKQYAAKGWHVFPCCWPDDKGSCGCHKKWIKKLQKYVDHIGREIGKAPIVANWQGAGATTTITGIDNYARKYPGCNWGGWFPNMIGGDVDRDHGGFDSLKKLQEKYGDLPPTLTHQTGGGGLHIFYVDKKGRDIRNTAAMAGYPGLDRRGNGGQVLLPGSKHRSGGVYSVHKDLPIAEVPDWLAEIDVIEKDNIISANTSAESNQPVPKGQQDEWLRDKAWLYASRGDSETAIAEKLKIDVRERFIDQDSNDPWTDQHIQEKAHRAFEKYKVKGNGYHDTAGGNGHKTSSYPDSTIEQVKRGFKQYLYMEDTGGLEILLGTIAANLIPGDPVWTLLVGAPGWGKTETINTASKIKHVHMASTLTEASLLSGTPKKDSVGRGGLLREIGDFGIISIKDFGGILSLTRESRGPILAGLREIYDGAWTRIVGSDGGRVLTWAGKAGLIGGATPSIDQHYGVMAALGERFSYYRLPEEDQQKMAEYAIEHAGEESNMRSDLASLVAGLFEHLTIPDQLPKIGEGERNKLVALATFSTRCRSAVERDSFQNREIQLVPGAESPTRLVKILLQLYRGLVIIGIDTGRAIKLVEKVALDSMPAPAS